MSPASLSERLRSSMANSTTAGSLSARARQWRWEIFQDAFPQISELRVLDLGGTVHTWASAPVRPKSVLVVNLAADRWHGQLDTVTTRIGDACHLPADLTRDSFDLVFCNSVLEHVGGYHQRQALAETARSMAPLHWVQTPYRYFPVEPHWIFPMFQFLPLASRASLARQWKVGHRRAPTGDSAAGVELALGVELISVTEMRHLFPDSEVLYERFGGLIKSLIAVKTA
jgi:hypothetical protein